MDRSTIYERTTLIMVLTHVNRLSTPGFSLVTGIVSSRMRERFQ